MISFRSHCVFALHLLFLLVREQYWILHYYLNFEISPFFLYVFWPQFTLLTRLTMNSGPSSFLSLPSVEIQECITPVVPNVGPGLHFLFFYKISLVFIMYSHISVLRLFLFTDFQNFGHMFWLNLFKFFYGKFIESFRSITL